MIEIKNLDFSYKKNHTVLSDITMNLKTGYIHGLLGKNGVGKTTLIRLISGLLFPESGQIKVGDNTPSERKLDFLEDIFFLNEDLVPTSLTINKYLSLNKVFYPKFSIDEFNSYMEEFEIKDFSQRIDKLSYGTKKKVFIAFGLATNAKLILLDEPTNGLDIPSKSSFRKIIQKSMTDEKCIIISTHQARDLQNILDNIIILDDTKLLLNATSEEITNKLWFGISDKVATEEPIPYQEDTIAGLAVVKQNTFNKESNLDVEMLFNAAFSNKKLFKELFDNNIK
mgnify:CR=1 FL=1